MQSCYEDLIAVDVEATTAEDAIRKVGKLLVDGGYVKTAYIDEVCEREVADPTGLNLEEMSIALPHASGKLVDTPAVCVARLAQPVRFQHMGDASTKVMAELIFMLAIKDPDEEVEILQNLMDIFTNSHAVEALKSADSKEELFAAALQYIG